MRRFFTEPDQIRGGRAVITGEDVRHIRQVLRMVPGDPLLVCCGDEWEYSCRIRTIEEDRVEAEILDAQKPGKELPSRLVLFQCLPKGDKMELIIQKAVELGAAEIVPVASARCVVRLDPKKAANKGKRWNSIAAEAAKQSKRMVIPPVHELMGWQEALEYAKGMDVRLIPYEKSEGIGRTRQIVSEIRPGQSVAVFIGPEGGFEETEVEAAEALGFQPISLGKRILRTETAGMTVLSILMYLLEEE